jgi:DNA-binding transcriptional LysR family regulator
MDLNALSDFVAVVQGGGISAGARLRGEPKQSVSRRMLALELSLGVRLFERSTRAVRLTAEGQLLHEQASRIVADVEETRRLLADRSAAPAGLLRISAPVLLGQSLLGDVVARTVLAHPQLRIEVVLSDRRVDLIEEGFDAAIRVGPLDDSSLVSRSFASAHSVVVAAPALLARVGKPNAPADLAGLPCVLFGDGVARATWRLTRGEDHVPVIVKGPVTASSLKLVHDVACGGAGFASLPMLLAQPALNSGALLRALPRWHTGLADLRIVFPSRRLLSPRLRAFIDTLVGAFGNRVL